MLGIKKFEKIFKPFSRNPHFSPGVNLRNLNLDTYQTLSQNRVTTSMKNSISLIRFRLTIVSEKDNQDRESNP